MTNIIEITIIILIILDIGMLRRIDKHEQAIAQLLLKTGLGEWKE